MQIKQCLVLGLCLVFSAFADETVKKEKLSPVEFTGEQLKVKERLEGLFENSKHVNDKAGKQKARNEIIDSVDWAAISKGCLGNAEWSKQSDTNRSAFRDLLRDVVTLTAFSRMDTFWKGTTYEFKKIEITKNKAVADVKFKTTEGEDYSLTYYFEKDKSRWNLNDLAFEDLVYSKQINEQIQFYLNEKKSFKSLLDKLRKKKSDLLEDAKS